MVFANYDHHLLHCVLITPIKFALNVGHLISSHFISFRLVSSRSVLSCRPTLVYVIAVVFLASYHYLHWRNRASASKTHVLATDLSKGPIKSVSFSGSNTNQMTKHTHTHARWLSLLGRKCQFAVVCIISINLK